MASSLCWKWILPAGLLAAAALGSRSGPSAAPAPPGKPLDADQKILHVLNRLEFGPRPGDVEAVRRMGIDRWIDQQLAPDSIDDSAAQSKLARLASLQKPPDQLMAMYRDDQQQNRALQLARLAAQQNGQANAAPGANAGAGAPAGAGPNANGAAAANPAGGPAMMQMAQRPGLDSIEALGELNDGKLLMACESKRQLQEVLVDFWSNHFNLDVKKGPVRTLKLADERDVIRPHVLGKFRDLLEASAKSPAMLFYLDNATSTRDFSDPSTAPPMGAGAGGPGAGNGRFFAGGGFFRPGPGQARPQAQAALQARNRAAAAGQGRKSGLNENYGRELMELHTLGVDGGYTQQDVQNVARCFTGWSIDQQTGAFRFYPFRHDFGEKIVLGHHIPAGHGIEDGEAVLDILASHPSTAHFIAHKLCMRFVSDNPPAKLVDRVANTFLATGGDLRAVIRAIVTSPEFNSPAAYQAKIKSPFEYAVSAVRALGATFNVPDPTTPLGRLRLVADGASSTARGGGGPGGRRLNSLAREIAAMGEPMFSHEAPTGYPEDSHSWVSTGSLLPRFNFAVALAKNEVAGVAVSPDTPAPTAGNPASTLDTLGHQILGTDLSATTRAAIEKQMGDNADMATLTGLILGSPEFQRR